MKITLDWKLFPNYTWTFRYLQNHHTSLIDVLWLNQTETYQLISILALIFCNNCFKCVCFFNTVSWQSLHVCVSFHSFLNMQLWLYCMTAEAIGPVLTVRATRNGNIHAFEQFPVSFTTDNPSHPRRKYKNTPHFQITIDTKIGRRSVVSIANELVR